LPAALRRGISLFFAPWKESRMHPLGGLRACGGSWRGTSTLQDPHTGVADQSPSTATVTPGPDWGWRTDVTPGDKTLRVVMHNVWPEEQGGKEEMAVEAVYARA
jgi:hypothetical protein